MEITRGLCATVEARLAENGEYGVFDVFPDSRGRRAHLVGEIPKQLALHGLPWLKGLPHMSFADFIAQRST
jgi:hypothetical protein